MAETPGRRRPPQKYPEELRERAVRMVLEVACGWVSWFNDDRLHGELADRSPAEFEAAYYLPQSQPDAA